MSAERKRTYFSSTIVWLLLAAVSIDRKVSCFNIERRVTAKSTLPYPSADRFSNPYRIICALGRNSCEKYGAKCSGILSCCTCECRGHNPNFLSSASGCLSTYSLGTHTVSHCLFNLKNSGERYVPTFSSHTDFQVRDITLQVNHPTWLSVLNDGSCKASGVHYIDRRGTKRLLFENRCSEIFDIEKRVDQDKVVNQLLKWKWESSPYSYFHKMQGKLLTMDIVCERNSRVIRSCLLFKVAGAYNDRIQYTSVESPRTCPPKKVFTSTEKPVRKSSTKLTVQKTTAFEVVTKQLPSKMTITATSSRAKTKGPSTESSTAPASEIHPPASLPDIETKASDTEATVPVTGTKVATNQPFINTGRTDTARNTWKNHEGANSKISSDSQNKHAINWLVTGLIIAVAVLLITLAASLFVLLRKRCTKRAQRNSGEFAMNVVYHGHTAGPEYEEATLPSKRHCSNDELDCYNEGNLYESIDNLNVTGATASAYEYAYNDASKVKLPDENDNKDEPQQPPDPGPVKNEYEVAFSLKPDHTCNSPVVEEYEDMTLTASEKAPLVAGREKYVNLRDSVQDNAKSGTDKRSNAVYEEMGPIKAPEEEPLVSESYIAPDSVSELT